MHSISNSQYKIFFSLVVLFNISQIFFYLGIFHPYLHKKHHLSDLKHFHDRRFKFHGINVQLQAVNLISECYAVALQALRCHTSIKKTLRIIGELF